MLEHTYRCDPQTAAAQEEANKNYETLTEDRLIFSQKEEILPFLAVGLIYSYILGDLRACW